MAVAHLTNDALGRIELDHLAPVKKLLKQFFSDAPWTSSDDEALADLVGPGNGWWRYDLDDAFNFAFGWHDGAFRLELSTTDEAGSSPDEAEAQPAPPILDDAFAGSVVPEATPNPRTIRFITGPIHTGPSRWYESAAQVDDPRVARLFSEFDDVANVLVGPDFVAVGIQRPDRWEQLLAPMLRVVEAEFPRRRPRATTTPAPPTMHGRGRRSTYGRRRCPHVEMRSIGRGVNSADCSWISARTCNVCLPPRRRPTPRPGKSWLAG